MQQRKTVGAHRDVDHRMVGRGGALLLSPARLVPQGIGRQDCIDDLPGHRGSRGFPDSNLGIALRDQHLRFLLLEKIL